MPLTPEDVRTVSFDKAPFGRRGYDVDQVGAFLGLVEAELARLNDRVAELERQPPGR